MEYGAANRRKSERKPIENVVRYRVRGRKEDELTGVGRTVNMSSSGVLLTTEKPVERGKNMELAIQWPANLDDGTRLKLVARGTVVRNADGATAVRIQQYEFRTLGSLNL